MPEDFGVGDELSAVYEKEEDLPKGVSQPEKFPPKAAPVEEAGTAPYEGGQ